MARFYVPHPQIERGLLKIKGDEVKHLRRVLRLKAGDGIIVFNGSAKEYEGTIVEGSSSSVTIRIQKIFSSHRESAIKIVLAQSLLKGEKMDYLIQKATELGINEIIPFFSSRSVPILEKKQSLRRFHRWERIVIEASKQCGRGVLPKIHSLKNYSEMLGAVSQNALRLILWEEEGTRLKEVLERSKGKNEVFFIVGPEGGLTPVEVAEAKEKGFIPVTLGKRILRSETASLCLLSILQYIWGDMG